MSVNYRITVRCAWLCYHRIYILWGCYT